MADIQGTLLAYACLFVADVEHDLALTH
jgi:hypothetical protein